MTRFRLSYFLSIILQYCSLYRTFFPVRKLFVGLYLFDEIDFMKIKRQSCVKKSFCNLVLSGEVPNLKMPLQTVKSCCCGCSLKTGTLIILIITLAGGFSYPFKCISVTGGGLVSNIIITIFSIAGFGVSVSGLYAVLKKKPHWLIPYMIAQVFVFMGLIIMMLVVAICGAVFLGDLLKITVDDKFARNVKQSGFSAVISFEVSSAMSLCLIYYSIIVVHSFYKELRPEYHEI